MSTVEIWQIVGAILLWSGSLTGTIMWLNKRFNELLPISRYDQRHEKLEDRIRKIELWAATQGYFKIDETLK